jgi:hypothetical protein
MSNCKDTMGNTLEVGHWVTIAPPQGLLWIAKVVEVSDGGVMLAIDKKNSGITPAKIRVILDITLNANPQMPVFPTLCRIVNPKSEEVIQRIMEEGRDGSPPVQ